jgi:DNA repair exonuclease SbcCD ATPase subunit
LDLDKKLADSRQHVTELENRLRALWDKLEGERKYYEDRIKRLEEAVDAYRTAYTPDGHVAPHDCFATGPKTGDPIQDLIACPGCWAERKAKEAKL